MHLRAVLADIEQGQIQIKPLELPSLLLKLIEARLSIYRFLLSFSNYTISKLVCEMTLRDPTCVECVFDSDIRKNNHIA